MSSAAAVARLEKVASPGIAPQDVRGEKPQAPAYVAQSAVSGATLIGLLAVAAIFYGFAVRRNEWIVPGEGWGYKMGIVGGSMMLALLAYPAFKRTRLFGSGTKAAFWLNVHMVLGLAGPLLIFYHSNFSTGAMNSNVALFSMILVAGSGVIGRYIYARVHSGMFGAKLDVGSLLSQSTKLMMVLEGDVGGSKGIISKAMADFSLSAVPKKSGLLTNLVAALAMPLKTQMARRRIMRLVKESIATSAKEKNWTWREKNTHSRNALTHVNEFLSAVSRASLYAFWERMFSLWHVFHVPLFFLLLVSGVIHVIAVHLY